MIHNKRKQRFILDMKKIYIITVSLVRELVHTFER